MTLSAWVLASRPRTLSAAVVPVLVGSAAAHAAGGFRAGAALAALFGAVLIQIGTNLANDAFDFEKGADTAERLGPTRAVQAGLLSSREVKRGMIMAFGLAATCGLYLAAVSGPVVVALGTLSILSGVLYTAGPYPLGYHGLGEVFVLAFFGFVAVPGTAFVEAGSVPRAAWWASVPVGALATAILVVNNVRDRVTDLAAGKRTLCVRLGRGAGIGEFGLMLAAAYAIPPVLALEGHPAALLPMLTIPEAVRLFLELRRNEGRALNATLAGTARLLLVFGALLAAGLAR